MSGNIKETIDCSFKHAYKRCKEANAADADAIITAAEAAVTATAQGVYYRMTEGAKGKGKLIDADATPTLADVKAELNAAAAAEWQEQRNAVTLAWNKTEPGRAAWARVHEAIERYTCGKGDMSSIRLTASRAMPPEVEFSEADGNIQSIFDAIDRMDQIWMERLICGDFARWFEAAEIDASLRNPIVPIVKAAIPYREVAPNRRLDAVMPAKMIMKRGGGRNDGRGALKRFAAPAYNDGAAQGAQRILPGFNKDDDVDGPALPLALYELDASGRSFGRTGERLPLRMFVESILAVPMDARNAGPVNVSVSLREYLQWIYPNGAPSPSRYWPRLMSAIKALDSYKARIPWHNPETGRGGLRRVVSISDIPRGAGALDDFVTMTVNLPPGTEAGAPINRGRLRAYGVSSAPAYRALLWLSMRWWEPGRTLAPVKRGGKTQTWIHKTDERFYEPIRSERELVKGVYPTDADSNFSRAKSNALEALEKMADAGDLRIGGGLRGKALGDVLKRGRLILMPPIKKRGSE